MNAAAVVLSAVAPIVSCAARPAGLVARRKQLPTRRLASFRVGKLVSPSRPKEQKKQDKSASHDPRDKRKPPFCVCFNVRSTTTSTEHSSLLLFVCSLDGPPQVDVPVPPLAEPARHADLHLLQVIGRQAQLVLDHRYVPWTTTGTKKNIGCGLFAVRSREREREGHKSACLQQIPFLVECMPLASLLESLI